MLMRVVLFLVMTFPSFSFSWMDKLFGAKFTWANLFGGLVLTQPFSLDCHHTLFFHLEQKWEGTKFLGYYETFLGYYKFIFHLFPYCFLENCKWGNGQLVEYNISTEEFKRECMYKLMLPIFFLYFMVQTWSKMTSHSILYSSHHPFQDNHGNWCPLPPTLILESFVCDHIF